MELLFDRREVFEDVRVVVFEVVEDRRAGTVVHELASLVEEARVVLVGFDHEGGLRIAQKGASFAPGGNAADEVARVDPGAAKNPGEKRRGRRFAVRARYGKDVASGENVLAHPLRSRSVGKTAVENGLEKGIAARNGVSHHPKIGFDRELLGAVAFGEFDPRRAQCVAHRRINPSVASRHGVSGLRRKLRDAAHEGAADAENVNVHASPRSVEKYIESYRTAGRSAGKKARGSKLSVAARPTFGLIRFQTLRETPFCPAPL